MNPIFARRHRAANSCTNSQPGSQGRTVISPSRQLSDCEFLVDPLTPPSSTDTAQDQKSRARFPSPEPYEDRRIYHKEEISTPGKLPTSKSLSFLKTPQNIPSSRRAAAENSKNFAQTLLESKRNMLAQVSLTPMEDRVRKSLGNSIKTASDMENKVSSSTSPQAMPKEEANNATMTLCDIEDEDFGLGDCCEPSFSGYNSRMEHCRSSVRSPAGARKTLDMKTWRELKNVVVGSGGTLQGGWIGQGFPFDTNIPYGIVQKKGGPCGVLAVVQALTIRNLMFGSEFCEPGLPVEIQMDTPAAASGMMKVEFSFAQSIASKRTTALCGAIVEILWNCAHNTKNMDNANAATVIVGSTSAGSTVCFSGTSVGDEMAVFNDVNELKEYVQSNLYRLDCVSLVYSAVLSRGLQSVLDDMDFPESPLLGQHGYCSQELVNLLLIGKAISNSFDDEILLGDKVLKGIESQSDVGLLSLFEHYDSCQVGSYLKCPKYPIWIVCSESHFSLLFSNELRLTTDSKPMKNFDLYYYDGLARQSNIIKLSIGFQVGNPKGRHSSNLTYGYSGRQSNNNFDNHEDDLVPPLEKCIRTKWKEAIVDWNGSEPIL